MLFVWESKEFFIFLLHDDTEMETANNCPVGVYVFSFFKKLNYVTGRLRRL